MINVVSHSLSSKNKVCSVTPSSSAVRGGGVPVLVALKNCRAATFKLVQDNQ